MQKIIITGAKGFLGRALIKKLESKKNLKIVGLDIENNPLFNISVLEKTLSGANIVYHFAGIKDPNNSDVFKVNVEGTKNLLDSIAKISPNAQLIFASTFAVYKLPGKKQVVSENFGLSPRNKYGESKLKAEKLIKEYSKKFGIKSSILRISNIYGVDEPAIGGSAVYYFAKNIKKKQKINLEGSGQQTRDFIYVDDVILAMIKAQNQNEKFEIYNICTGNDISILKLISLIENASGIKAKVEFTELGSQGGFWKGSNKLAVKKLDWSPKISIDEGIAKILNFEK